MAVDMFLKIDGVDGESKAKGHVKEIDVLAWSWGASNSGSAHSGGGAGSGKVNVQDIHVTKYVDSSTPKLLLACFAGTHYDNALLAVRKAGGELSQTDRRRTHPYCGPNRCNRGVLAT